MFEERVTPFPKRKVLIQSNPQKASFLRHFLNSTPTPEQIAWSLKWNEPETPPMLYICKNEEEARKFLDRLDPLI